MNTTSSLLVKEFDFDGVRFDSETSIFVAQYQDEISMYRAKRNWLSILKHTFMLEEKKDFTLATTYIDSFGRYVMECKFTSSSGRYIFWRITNNQTPEAQYLIETAHIPLCSSRHNDLIQAPDMRPLTECVLDNFGLVSDLSDENFLNKKPVSKWLQNLLKTLGE